MKKIYFLFNINRWFLRENSNLSLLPLFVKKYSSTFLLLTAIGLGIAGCYQDSALITPDTDKPTLLNNAIITSIRPVMETVQMPDAGSNFAFTTKNGTLIDVPANAFVLKNTTTLATGKLSIRYFEVVKKGEMILYGTPTISDGRILNSAGAYLVKAYDERGNELILDENNHKALQFRIPIQGIASDDMALFVGGEVDSAKYRFNWKDLEAPQVNIQIDSSGQLSYYQFFSPTLQWINCDRFWDYTEKTALQVTLTGTTTYNTSNTVAYLVFKNRNSVIRFNWSADNSLALNDLPTGEDVTVVLLTQNSKTSYELATKELKLNSATNTLTLTPDATSIEKIKTYLESL